MSRRKPEIDPEKRSETTKKIQDARKSLIRGYKLIERKRLINEGKVLENDHFHLKKRELTENINKTKIHNFTSEEKKKLFKLLHDVYEIDSDLLLDALEDPSRPPSADMSRSLSRSDSTVDTVSLFASDSETLEEYFKKKSKGETKFGGFVRKLHEFRDAGKIQFRLKKK